MKGIRHCKKVGKVLVLALLFGQLAAALDNPPSQLELNGFLLGQHKNVLETTFGPPDQETTTEDGWVYRVYYLPEPSEGYMIFKFTNYDLGHIFSIQIAGDASVRMAPFVGLRLGDSREKIEEMLGQPSEVRPNTELNLELILYQNRNYSVEIDAEGKLSSIQIFGFEGFRPDKFYGVPRIKLLKDCLLATNKECLLDLLAPDFEVYKDGQTYTFTASARTELTNPDSQLLRFLAGERGSLRAVFVDEGLTGGAEGRIIMGGPIASVYKFPKSKIVREVVYKMFAGDWRVWEIQFR